MTISEIVDAMVVSGCTSQQIAHVVRAWEENGGWVSADTARAAAREMVIEVWNKTGGFCSYCGEPVALRGKRGITIDHVVPLSKGGHSLIDNLVPACKSCNSSKKDMDLEAFRAIRGKFAYPVGGSN